MIPTNYEWSVAGPEVGQYGFSPATQVFEAAEAGACLITDAFVGVETFFEPGRELLVAKDGEEVADHVQSFRISAPRRSEPRR